MNKYNYFVFVAWFAIHSRKCQWERVVFLFLFLCVSVGECQICVPVLKLDDWTLVVETNHLHDVSQPVPEVGFYS